MMYLNYIKRCLSLLPQVRQILISVEWIYRNLEILLVACLVGLADLAGLVAKSSMRVMMRMATSSKKRGKKGDTLTNKEQENNDGQGDVHGDVSQCKKSNNEKHNDDYLTLSSLVPSSKNKRLKPQPKSEKQLVYDNMEGCKPVTKACMTGKKAVSNKGVPSPIFKQYLKKLSLVEKKICMNVSMDDRFAELYGCVGSTVFLTVGESWCVYPDSWLSDKFITVYTYDMQKELLDSGATKMILSSSFQGAIFKDDERFPRSFRRNLIEYEARTLDQFVPENVDNIEQIFIPVLDCKNSHWFLVIYNVSRSECWILDSIGVSDYRFNIVYDLMENAEKRLGRHRLAKLFKNFSKCLIHTVTVPEQPNGNDCGMYVIKYIECGVVEACRNLKFGTSQMCVERLKCLAKLVQSRHNRKENVARLEADEFNQGSYMDISPYRKDK